MSTNFVTQPQFTGPTGSATYRYQGLPKATLHPWTTARGTVVSGFEMSDHVWHRGLWFTIKFINGDNYWEEHEPFGTQVHNQPPTVSETPLGHRRLSATVDYRSPATADKPAVVTATETRHLTFSIGPSLAANGTPGHPVTQLDWSSTFTARQDLLLDRTPYTTWGGYGGLSFRASRELHDGELILADGSKQNLVTGQSSPWLALRAKVDGGLQRGVLMTVFDHPSNQRSPTPWYGRSINGFTFWNAAFLFHEPLALPAGQSITFNYRLLLTDLDYPAPVNGQPGSFHDEPLLARISDLCNSYRQSTPQVQP